jgi:tetratricopeptide (TPR) repeat protein
LTLVNEPLKLNKALPFHPACRRFPLGSWFRMAACAALVCLGVEVCLAADTPRIALDTSETLFSVLTAVNACGYDQELDNSDPLRSQIRAEVARIISNSQDTSAVTNEMCQFYREHQQPDSSRELAQYVSLALYLEGPPNFAPKNKEGELPPDAARLVGFSPLLLKFYQSAGLHELWVRHRPQYEGLVERYHDALSKMVFNTDIYLKLPTAGFVGRQFTVYLEPMGAPAQINARIYGTDYFVVISPVGSSLKMEQIRHTYLHYVLDPLAMKRPEAMKRLSPLLDAVRTAPMEESFKNDISLLVTESLIRAVEARNKLGGKSTEEQREQAVDASVSQGFILTRYFYNALAKFEQGPTGFRDAYGDLLNAIDVRGESKRVAEIEFANGAVPEVVYIPRKSSEQLLITAEKRLSAGDAATAQKLAQQALEEKSEDPGRALFILAQVATMNRDMEGARDYFQRALGVAKEPKVVAWSHIYLGRIFDLQEEREEAVGHYRAAMDISSSLPEAHAAAQKGLQQPYEPPVAPQPQQ